MGFHQRAELLLYEGLSLLLLLLLLLLLAMSYTNNPYEAHLQLGLLFLDKEGNLIIIIIITIIIIIIIIKI